MPAEGEIKIGEFQLLTIRAAVHLVTGATKFWGGQNANRKGLRTSEPKTVRPRSKNSSFLRA